MHWLTHLYGPRNLYKSCPSCGKETNVEELEIISGICHDCEIKPAPKKRLNETDNINKEGNFDQKGVTNE